METWTAERELLLGYSPAVLLNTEMLSWKQTALHEGHGKVETLVPADWEGKGGGLFLLRAPKHCWLNTIDGF